MSHLQRYLEQPDAFPPDHLAAALRRQQIYGGSLDTALLELELVTPQELEDLLVRATGLPVATLEDLAPTHERAWASIPEDLLRIAWAVPLRKTDGRPAVAVHPDLPDERLGALYRAIPSVRLSVAPECCIEKIAAERDGSVVPQRYASLCVSYVSALRGHRSDPSTPLTLPPLPAPAEASAPPAATPPPAAAALEPALPAPTREPDPPVPIALPRIPKITVAALEGDDSLPAGVPQFSVSPRRAPPVRFSARGTALRGIEGAQLSFDESAIRRALSDPREALVHAKSSEEALRAYLCAAAVVTDRLALFRCDGAALHAMPCDTSRLEVAAGTSLSLEGTPISDVLRLPRWAGDTTDPALQRALGYDDVVPCLMCSVLVSHQVIMVLYADHGGREFLPGEASLLGELSQIAGATFERLLVPQQAPRSEVAPPPAFGTAESSGGWGAAPEPIEHEHAVAHELGAPVPPPPPMATTVAPPTTSGSPHGPAPRFSPPPLDEQENSGIIPLSSPIDQPSARGRIQLDEEDWQPPVRGEDPAVDSEQRRIDAALDALGKGESTVATVRAFGTPGLVRLAARFPGPLEVLRRDLRALPPPSAHGPFIRTMIAMGQEAVPHLLGLFTHADPDVRFYAAFAFQELRDPECMLPLSKLSFDGSADVRVIAMRVLETYSRYPRFPRAVAAVRRELSAADRNHQLYAARGVGTLRDVSAIDTLIELLASKDRFIQEAALESLCSITGQQHGLKPHRWKNWYLENRDRHRVEWIIDSLRHRDLPVRRWAQDELIRVTGHRVPFSPLGDRQARDVAARAWTDWWVSVGHQQFREPRSRPQ